MNKISAERNQRVLLELAGLPGNGAQSHAVDNSVRSDGFFSQMHVRTARVATHDGLHTVLGSSSGVLRCVSRPMSTIDHRRAVCIARAFTERWERIYLKCTSSSLCERIVLEGLCSQEESHHGYLVKGASRSAYRVVFCDVISSGPKSLAHEEHREYKVQFLLHSGRKALSPSHEHGGFGA